MIARLVLVVAFLIGSGLTGEAQTPPSGSSGREGASASPAQDPSGNAKDTADSPEAPAVQPKTVTQEVRQAFEEWQDAYASGDTRGFLMGFAQIPDLLVRISSNEWRGFEKYRDAVAAVAMPKTNFPFRDIRVVPIDENAAFVSYTRGSSARDENGKPLAFWGTAVYARTFSGWKIVAWHTHAVVASQP